MPPAQGPAGATAHVACPPYPPVSALSSEALIAQHGAQLEGYRLQGGAWLHDVILLNEDFDFSTAMSMPDIGAGLAAHKRLSNNEAKRKALEARPLHEEVRKRIDALRQHGWSAFFVLWGSDGAARLSFHVEPHPDCQISASGRVLHGDSHSYHGHEGWTHGNVLSDAALSLVRRDAEAERTAR